MSRGRTADVFLVVGAPAVACLIGTHRALLGYLGYVLGGWLWWSWMVPLVAYACAAVVAVWACLCGGVHGAAGPVLVTCGGLTAAGWLAWEVTMR